MALKANVKNRVFLLFMVVLLCIVFVEVNYLAHIYDTRIDLTRFKQHTLSKQTLGLLKELKGPVKISVLYVGLPPKYLEDLLNEYKRVTKGKVDFEIIDPLVQLGYAAQFGMVIKSGQKKAIIQSGQTKRDIDFTDEPLNEDEINNAVIRITRPARHACFLTGHGEYRLEDEEDGGLQTFRKLLLANNIIAQEFVLGMLGGIPDSCDVLVIAGAKSPLTDKEEEAIEQYLEKGGDALFLVENTLVSTLDKPLTPEQQELNPSLNGILTRWGVKVANDIVVDLASHASGDEGSPATRNYIAHPAITEGLDYTFYIRPRSISVQPLPRKTIKVAPVVLTASDNASWGETNRYLNAKFDPGVDREGPVPIAYVIYEPKTGQDLSDTRIAVFTDADFLTNNYIKSYSNAQMGLNVINWLTEADYKAFVDKNELKISQMDLTSGQKRNVIAILFIIPLVIALCGAMVWLKYK